MNKYPLTNDLNFTTNSLFDTVTYDSNANNWHFLFADKINISVSGFWRLLEKNEIVLVSLSLDHGHQFGLSKPVDLTEKIKNRLTAKKITKLEVKKDTADLTLTLTDQFKLEIYIASSSYETYDFSISNKRYIGLGSGELAIIDIV